jgi:hypothetical protein
MTILRLLAFLLFSFLSLFGVTRADELAVPAWPQSDITAWNNWSDKERLVFVMGILAAWKHVESGITTTEQVYGRKETRQKLSPTESLIGQITRCLTLRRLDPQEVMHLVDKQMSELDPPPEGSAYSLCFWL